MSYTHSLSAPPSSSVTWQPRPLLLRRSPTVITAATTWKLRPPPKTSWSVKEKVMVLSFGDGLDLRYQMTSRKTCSVKNVEKLLQLKVRARQISSTTYNNTIKCSTRSVSGYVQRPRPQAFPACCPETNPAASFINPCCALRKNKWKVAWYYQSCGLSYRKRHGSYCNSGAGRLHTAAKNNESEIPVA